MFKEFAPTRNKMSVFMPWEGSVDRKPWDFEVTVAIPVLDTFEQLSIALELIRLQTVPTYVTVVDTGSCSEQLEMIESLRSERVEVHSLKLNSVKHPSDFPAVAMDLCFSMCRTEYLFATHADVFLRRRDFLESMLALCRESKVVGYEISPRAHHDWKGMVSHTASMYHMPTMDRIGFGWSLRRLCSVFGVSDSKPNPNTPGWPDTELLGNYLLRQNGIEPLIVGREGNFTRTLDDNIDHFKSFTSGKLYSHSYYKVVSKWFEQARRDALERIDEWKREDTT